MKIYKTMSIIWIRFFAFCFMIHLMTPLVLSECVVDETGLRKAIFSSPNNPIRLSRIYLCKKLIMLTGPADGIDITNKGIELRCNVSSINFNGCTIDGNKTRRLFWGERSRFSAKAITFVNGYNEVGGGSLAFYNRSSVLLHSCEIKDSISYHGGAILMQDSTLDLVNVTIRRSKVIDFEGGFFMQAEGGGVALYQSNLSATNVLFIRNNGEWGGAIFADGSRLSMRNMRFEGNSATYGGAMYSFQKSTSIVVNSTFTNNTAIQSSGGVRIERSSATFDRVKFIGNKATSTFGKGHSVEVTYYSDATEIKYGSIAKFISVDFIGSVSSFPNVDFYSTLVVSASNVSIVKTRFLDEFSHADVECTDACQVSLDNSTFVLPKKSYGSNLLIGNANENKDDDSSVTCLNSVFFCYGKIIMDFGMTRSTNCKINGVVGRPGLGVCKRT